MTWEPSEELVRKSALMAYITTRAKPLDESDPVAMVVFDWMLSETRITLIAARAEIVAEAVQAEREACIKAMRTIPHFKQVKLTHGYTLSRESAMEFAIDAVEATIRVRSS